MLELIVSFSAVWFLWPMQRIF